jgi:protocatechuate 3,4-dioxygenase beta subunit
VIDGRVLDGITHEGVPNAELSFLGDGGASTFRTSSDGAFELTPTTTGTFVLSTITAPGYLPYAPELGHSSVRVTLARGQAVHGVTLLLFPAVDYQGLVVDARGAPVAGARVRLLGSPAGEQVLETGAAEWKTGPDGRFTFQAANGAVLEASRGATRGWAHVDRNVTILKKLTIQLGHAPPRDATITGHVRDRAGAPIADALVRADPSTPSGDVATVFATTGPDGAFTLAGVDRASYDLSAEAEDHVRGVRTNILGGSRNVELTLDASLPLAGRVVDQSGAPVPVFTLLVRRRAGTARPLVATRSLIDPQGRFAVRVPPGDYDLVATARGSARGTPTQAAAGATDVRIVLGSGATLRGKVIASDDHAPIGNASVECETPGGGASALPADPGTVTRRDGTFELTGISAGPLSIHVAADGYHGKIEAAMTATDGATLGPITIALTRAGPDEATRTELVGIGIGLSPDGDALRVTQVLPGGGAADAGIGFGDRVIAIDGLPVAPLGVEGTVAKIRGVAGTTVTLTLRRDGHDVLLVIERGVTCSRSSRASAKIPEG